MVLSGKVFARDAETGGPWPSRAGKGADSDLLNSCSQQNVHADNKDDHVIT